MNTTPRSILLVGIVLMTLAAACARPAAAPPSPTPAPTRMPTRTAAPTLAPTAKPTAAPTAGPTPAPFPAAIIEKYRATIPKTMASQGLPGLALAVVDEDGIVWSEGFGYTDSGGKTPVTADTPFSLQSVSKMVTAAGVMLAVQDGLVDLDAPITTYLPGFTVNSIFEEHPERKITLRHLLSHTAGFTHDPAVGNNNDLGHWQIEPHIKSVSDTWLRFPVGAGYAYSNIGPDLAAYIVRVRAGKPFEQYMQERLFGPLGMNSTTYDPVRVRETAGRATGHMNGVSEIPVEVPMQGAGGLYSTANDMAKFVQWHLQHGQAGGKQLLRPALLDETYNPANPAGATTGYGLGTGVSRRHELAWIGHSGGGFGFLSDVYWYPGLGLGAVVLTNSVNHGLQGRLIDQLLDDIMTDPAGPYAARLAAAPKPPAGNDGCTSNECLPVDLANRIELLGREVTPADLARWQGYVGDYTAQFWQAEVPMYIKLENGHLVGGVPRLLNDTPLIEVQPGLFFTPDGEALDLRGPMLTFKGVRLTRAPAKG